MERFVCIHGHFYQPPRENPWLEEIELQDSAYPYHDWNERVSAECYAPNSASRILDATGGILDIVNNYSKISFDFGPTLLAWIERRQPAIYRKIIQADAESRERFGGHGSAIAQAYNHLIMPLADARDKRTQVIWGIRDFEHRFGRFPEGMWLPETAVDLETLDIMAELGVRFTVLAPHQAARFRAFEQKQWTDASGGRIDPKRPYLCRLSSGRTIVIFFYDGLISREVAFNGLLNRGEDFARKLIGAFDPDAGERQLVNIATDGETYGHHHHRGEMALSYCLHHIESNEPASITVYGEFLDRHPPDHEVEIFENSSWSCVHGVERWRSNCGCTTGPHTGWTQVWREPLRGAMDWLRGNLSRLYEDEMSRYTDDPWRARDDYIEIVLDRSAESMDRFLAGRGMGALSGGRRIIALKLLEMQRHEMLMYTSCGWFFEELSGLETVQVLNYAARAIQMAKEATGVDLEDAYTRILERAPSNIPDFGNGLRVYELLVKPAAVDLPRVGIHYGISSLFFPVEDEPLKIYAYTAESVEHDRRESGVQKLAMGRARIRSDITTGEMVVCFTVLHLGEHNVIGGGKPQEEGDEWEQLREKIGAAFERSDLSAVITAIDGFYETHEYGLRHLFRDEQRKVMNLIVQATLHDVEWYHRYVHDHYYPLMQALMDMGIPLPRVLLTTVEFILNTDLVNMIREPDVDSPRIDETVEKMKRWSVHIDKSTIGYEASNRIGEMMRGLAGEPRIDMIPALSVIESLLDALRRLEVRPNLWAAQNEHFSIAAEALPAMKSRAAAGDGGASAWVEKFERIGAYLKGSVG